MRVFDFLERNASRMLLLLCCGILIFMGVYMTSNVVMADNEEEEVTEDMISLYDVSVVLSQYVSNVTKPTNPDAKEDDKTGEDGPVGLLALRVINAKSRNDNEGHSYYSESAVKQKVAPGDAGAFVGFGEKNWFSSLLSNSSVSYSYETFDNVLTGVKVLVKENAENDNNDNNVDMLWGDKEITDERSASVIRYCRFGYLLGTIGFDKTDVQSSINWGTTIAGGLVFMAYILSLVVPLMFSVILSILQSLNPFNLFLGAESLQKYSWLDKSTAEIEGGALGGLFSMLSSWYDFIYNMSWEALVPIFFAVLTLSLLLLKSARQNAGKKIKKYIIRIGFLVLGIPLLGGTYTSMLDSLKDMVSTGCTASSKVIASTFLDFESWAENTRLAIPEGVMLGYTSKNAYSNAGVRPTSLTLMKARQNCFLINKASGAISIDGTSPFEYIASKNPENLAVDDYVAKYNTNVLAATDGAVRNENGDIVYQNKGNESGNTVADITDMLFRYMNGGYYYGSDYESKIKAELYEATSSDKDANKHIYYMFKHSSKPEQFDPDWVAESIDGNDDAAGNYALQRFHSWSKWGGYNIFGNGGLYTYKYKTEEGGDGHTYFTEIKLQSNSKNRVIDKDVKVYVANENDDGLWNCQGLSTMSMFNYLNTSFNASNMVVFSSEKASSGFVREGHKSVNLIGTGLISALYYLNCLILLVAFTIIGLFYCFSIVFANLRKGIQLITSIPFAMLGAIRAIAKVITYAIMMIVEVVATCFVYGIITELLLGVTSIMEGPVIQLINNLPFIQFARHSNVILAISMFFTCLIYIWFIVIALKIRKTVVKSINEAASDIVDKFLDTKNEATPNAGGALGKLGGAVAQGAGAALGAKAMNGGMNAINNRFGGGGSPGTQQTVATGDGTNNPGTVNEYDGDNNQLAENNNQQNMQGGNQINGPTSMNRLEDKSGNSSDTTNTMLNGGGSEQTLLENGEPSAGDAMNQATDKMFEENNQEYQDKALGEQMQNMDSLETPIAVGSINGVLPTQEEMQAKDHQKEVEAEAMVSNMTGETSAIEEDNNREMQNELAKEQMKDGMKKQVSGTTQELVGAAEVAAAVETGDVKMAEDGVKNMKTGEAAKQDGQNKMMNAQDEASAKVNQQQLEKNKAEHEQEKRIHESQVQGEQVQTEGYSMNSDKNSKVWHDSQNVAEQYTNQETSGYATGGSVEKYDYGYTTQQPKHGEQMRQNEKSDNLKKPKQNVNQTNVRTSNKAQSERKPSGQNTQKQPVRSQQKQGGSIVNQGIAAENVMSVMNKESKKKGEKPAKQFRAENQTKEQRQNVRGLVGNKTVGSKGSSVKGVSVMPSKALSINETPDDEI